MKSQSYARLKSLKKSLSQSQAQSISEIDLAYLHKAERNPNAVLSMPLEPTLKKVSPLAAWPRIEVELGPGSGIDTFQSQEGPYTLTNNNLSGNAGYFVHTQAAITPRFVTEATYQTNSGQINDNSGTVLNTNFETDHVKIGARYRLFPNHDMGYCYYLGLGGEYISDYRFAYLSSTSGNIVNRPQSFDELKFSAGAEFNSYYLFKGRLELNLYRTLASSLAVTDGNYFSIETSLSHSVIGNMYLGLGAQYIVQAYSFISNDLGPTLSGSVNKTALDAFLFLGFDL
jgi:hypothetical protein